MDAVQGDAWEAHQELEWSSRGNWQACRCSQYAFLSLSRALLSDSVSFALEKQQLDYEAKLTSKSQEIAAREATIENLKYKMENMTTEFGEMLKVWLLFSVLLCPLPRSFSFYLPDFAAVLPRTFFLTWICLCLFVCLITLLQQTLAKMSEKVSITNDFEQHLSGTSNSNNSSGDAAGGIAVPRRSKGHSLADEPSSSMTSSIAAASASASGAVRLAGSPAVASALRAAV